jgi:DNA-binding CsgD family transcriptional regulator
VLSIFTINLSVYSQTKIIDSLKSQLVKTNTSVDSRFSIYNQLSEYYRVNEKYVEAENITKAQISLGEKEKNYTEAIKAHTQSGIIKLNESKYNLVQKDLDAISELLKKTNDPIAKYYAEYLHIYNDNTLGNYEQAIKGIQKILPSVEKLPKEIVLTTKLNYFLYGIHSNWEDVPNATKYAEKAIFYAQKSGDKNLLSSAYSAMAVCKNYIYLKSENQKDLDVAIDYCKKATELYYQNPGEVSDYVQSLALLNLAAYHLEHKSISPLIRSEIEKSTAEVLNLTSKQSNVENIQAAAYGILSNLAQRDNNLQLSESYLLKAEEALLQQKPVSYYTLQTITRDLANLYAKLGQFEKAYTYQNKVNEVTGLLYDETQSEIAKKLEYQYQSERKEDELKTLMDKTESLKKEKLLYIGLVAIALIGGFFMFRSYHYKLRYSLEREKILDTEKHEANIQVQLEKEEQARLKAEQELLELQQQKLQNQVLANELHIEHKNEVLQQIKNQLSDSEFNINKVVKEENWMDNEFEKAKFRIQDLHPNFFNNLNQKSVQKLTPLDLKYCAYLYLGMDTKQIANLLNVEPKSVRMTKYRLKKKFNLDENTDLDLFFQQTIS